MSIYPRKCDQCNTIYVHKSSYFTHKAKGRCERKLQRTKTNITNNITIQTDNNEALTQLREQLEIQKCLVRELQVKCNLAAELTFVKSEYVYIMQLSEFFRLKENVYKIGRTGDIVKRLASYPKGTILLFCWRCKDSITLENQIKKAFHDCEEIQLHSGSETYEGDIVLMQKKINELFEMMHPIDNQTERRE